MSKVWAVNVAVVVGVAAAATATATARETAMETATDMVVVSRWPVDIELQFRRMAMATNLTI